VTNYYLNCRRYKKYPYIQMLSELAPLKDTFGKEKGRYSLYTVVLS